MGMSRKDYEAAAAVIANGVKHAQDNTPVQRKAKLYALREVAGGLASMFARDNGRFDRDKFMTACGLGTVPCAKKHRIEKGDYLYLYGERVKVKGVPARTRITIVELYQGREYGEPRDVALDQLNY